MACSFSCSVQQIDTTRAIKGANRAALPAHLVQSCALPCAGGFFAREPSILRRVGDVLLDRSQRSRGTLRRWLVGVDAFDLADETTRLALYKAGPSSLWPLQLPAGRAGSPVPARNLSDMRKVFNSCSPVSRPAEDDFWPLEAIGIAGVPEGSGRRSVDIGGAQRGDCGYSPRV